VKRIGLTGGIGAGKSTVAGMLAERGAVVIDADEIARQLVEPGQPALVELITEFGPRIQQPDGTLSRGELARLAFSDPRATTRLNEIMHPLIRAEAERQIRGQSRTALVVYDMPLLVETGQSDLVDVVVVVDVPEEVQIQRSVDLRGLDEQDVRRRMSVQASREERIAAADHVIDNSGPAEFTRHQVAALWDVLTSGATGSDPSPRVRE
jgi:dephospho-CoA kinase